MLDRNNALLLNDGGAFESEAEDASKNSWETRNQHQTTEPSLQALHTNRQTMTSRRKMSRYEVAIHGLMLEQTMKLWMPDELGWLHRPKRLIYLENAVWAGFDPTQERLASDDDEDKKCNATNRRTAHKTGEEEVAWGKELG